MSPWDTYVPRPRRSRRAQLGLGALYVLVIVGVVLVTAACT